MNRADTWHISGRGQVFPAHISGLASCTIICWCLPGRASGLRCCVAPGISAEGVIFPKLSVDLPSGATVTHSIMSKRHYTIGEVASRCGISARRVRFYSDAGLLPAGIRTEAGYRVYSDDDLVRLELICALRTAGATLAEIRAILEKRRSLKEALEIRLEIMERELRNQTALVAALRVAVRADEPAPSDIGRFTAMIDMSSTRRRETVEAFFDDVTAPVSFDPAWKEAMIGMVAPDLPADATARQLDAWISINNLMASPAFIAAMRAQALDTGRTIPLLQVRDNRAEWHRRQNHILSLASEAMEKGVDCLSETGMKLADSYIDFMAWNRGVENDRSFRAHLWQMWCNIAEVDEFWRLVDDLNGRSSGRDMAYEWLSGATFARLRSGHGG